MSEPVWINDDVVMALHRKQLLDHGGGNGLRDAGLLESALAAPRNLFLYEQAPLIALAACYLWSIARNQPFVDGNKRTAWVCARLFLKLNALDISASDEEKVLLVFSVAAGQLSQEQVSEWLEQHLC